MFCKLPTLEVSFHFDPSYPHPKKKKKNIGKINKHAQAPRDTRFANKKQYFLTNQMSWCKPGKLLAHNKIVFKNENRH